jgi:hypothetical protein
MAEKAGLLGRPQSTTKANNWIPAEDVDGKKRVRCLHCGETRSDNMDVLRKHTAVCPHRPDATPFTPPRQKRYLLHTLSYIQGA